ncbi:MAG: 4-alpha-glucanotransferase, partial [Chloroflexota bacterium]
MRTVATTSLLQRLARLYGVQTAYYDVSRRRREASVDSLLAALRALGAPVASLEDVPGAWRQYNQLTWQRLVEPVTVAWDGRPANVKVRLPAGADGGALACWLALEDGKERRWTCRMADLAVVEAAGFEGTRYTAREIPLPGSLPPGYHHFTLEVPGKTWESLVIAAPARAYAPPGGRRSRAWGVFLPLYALHGQRSWGSGDFSDLERLAEWVAGLGGSTVATLPLLAAFLDDENGVPGPYAPASRLFYNEFYVDVTRATELEQCPAAQAAISSPRFQQELAGWRNSPAVDYHGQAAARRRILEEL